jgi:hypothetical protein
VYIFTQLGITGTTRYTDSDFARQKMFCCLVMIVNIFARLSDITVDCKYFEQSTYISDRLALSSNVCKERAGYRICL